MKSNYKLQISFFICLLTSFFCNAQMQSPNVKCVSVLANGDVQATWTIPPPGGFVSYHVDTSSNPSIIPFANYTTVTPYTATSATHIGANANAKRMYYRVFTEDNLPSFSIPTDTFSTIFLTVTNTGGNALLNWNKISNHPIPTSSNWYKIYREYPTGNWTLRDSTQNLTYTDITDVCNKNNSLINYRIEISDNTGCTSVSNVAGALFLTDKTPPTIRPIDTVSVNTLNKATISWFNSTSPDCDSVIIYKYTNPTWTQIASVKSPLTFYTYTASAANTASETFRIAFKDSCGNLSAQGIEHKTIYLAANLDVCAATCSLQWNKYINMNPAISQYEIYRSMNAAPFALIGTVPATDSNYVDNSIALGNSYCYLVRATDGTKSSSSNRVCFNANVSAPPAFSYSRYATVISDKSITITAHVDPAQGVKYYNLQRALNLSSNFYTIQSLPKIGNALTFTDPNVSTPSNIYSYRWQAIDSCGHPIQTSDTSTTMLLTATIAPNLDVSLSWNDYSSWLGNVDHYEIYRAVDGLWDPSPIGTTTFTGTGGTYTDDVSPFMNSRGNISYYVEAVEGTGNPYGFKDSSRSNIAKVTEFPKFYVPNAFTPNDDGKNDVFLPIIGFIEPSEYLLTIFDNTGTPVWSTTNPAEGWPGTKHGHKCMENVYMYVINCKASNGEDSRIAGTVTLFR